jgi:hypothetical protein
MSDSTEKLSALLDGILSAAGDRAASAQFHVKLISIAAAITLASSHVEART